MTTIRATINDRRIEIPAPAELADGTVVLVEFTVAPQKIGLDESEWNDTAVGIDAWIQSVRQLAPLIFTDAELTELAAARDARRRMDEVHFADRADRLAKAWE